MEFWKKFLIIEPNNRRIFLSISILLTKINCQKLTFVSSNKLIRNLEKLSRKEMTRFKEFVFSPYLNKHEEVRRLVAYLSEVYPRLDEKKCAKELLYKSVFDGGKYSEKQLAPVLTYTQRLLEQFWAYEEFRSDSYFQRYLYLRQLRAQQEFGPYERLFKEMMEHQEAAPSLGNEQALMRYLLAGEGERYWSQFNKPEFEVYFQKRQTELDEFYLTEKLKDACEALFRQEVKRDERAPRLAEAVIQEIEQNIHSYQQVPPIITHYMIYRMLAGDAPGLFQEALTVFRKWEASFSQAEISDLYNQFKNYCLIRINQGDQAYLTNLFELYQYQLDKGLLLEDGVLSEWNYKNIVAAGLRLKQYEWVLQFIENYKESLAPEFKDNAYKFNLASYHLSLGQPQEAMLLLREVEYSDLRYNLGAKTMLLQTYYELEEYDPLFSLTESFRQLLMRDKTMSENFRKGYNNLFRLTRKAAHLRSQLDYLSTDKARQELLRIKENLSKTGDVFSRAWLESKLDSLGEEI